jgi:hypothetical protein
MNKLTKAREKNRRVLSFLRICPFLVFGGLFSFYFSVRILSISSFMVGLLFLLITFVGAVGTIFLCGDGTRIKNEIEENKHQIDEKINSFFSIK